MPAPEKPASEKPRDLRRYARQTNYRLLVGGIALLYLVGGGLIYLIYGRAALVSGLVCITTGLIPVILVYVFLAAMGWIAKKANEE
jgi:hypothetical protein